MKQAKMTAKPPSRAPALDAKQFPLNAQAEATAGRDQVREVVPVHAPRQSKRPVERASKGR